MRVRMVWAGLVVGAVACAGSGDGPTDSDTDPGTADDTVADDGHTDDTDVGPATFADVEILLARSCATIGCHAGAELETGLDLSAGAAYADLVDVPSAQVPALDRVEPGDPVNSYLMAKLEGTHEDVGGEGEIMPSKFGLPAAEVEVFRAWIAAGALDN